MPKPSLRDHLLDAGLKTFFRLGYQGAGVRDITAAAKASPGSFTNHFRSKEAFAGEVLERYFDGVRRLMAETLGNPDLPARDRLRNYLDRITARLAADGWTRGCLIGDLSLEAPPHSEELRVQLTAIFAEWRGPFIACIREGQEAGEIGTGAPAEDLADVLLEGWQGAMLRMKVERRPEPLEQFKRVAFATFLAPPTGGPSD